MLGPIVDRHKDLHFGSEKRVTLQQAAQRVLGKCLKALVGQKIDSVLVHERVTHIGKALQVEKTSNFRVRLTLDPTFQLKISPGCIQNRANIINRQDIAQVLADGQLQFGEPILMGQSQRVQDVLFFHLRQ